MILHCMKKDDWEKVKNEKLFNIQNAEGFVHCSTVEYFWRVAPKFKNVKEDLVLLCIDENKLKSEVKYEDYNNCGRLYPHIYGPINADAVINVLPFSKDENKNWIKNPELGNVNNK